MTPPPLDLDLWRLHGRFVADARVHSDLARRVFPLFLRHWAAQGAPAEPVVVSLGGYARTLRSDRTRVAIASVGGAFTRLVVLGWLAEGPRVSQRRTFTLGPLARCGPALQRAS